MSTFELVCLCYTYYNHSLLRFGAGVVQVVKLVAQQMLFLIRIRIGVTHSTKCYQPVKHGCQPVVDCVETGTPQGVK